jgi:hypothetical protein
MKSYRMPMSCDDARPPGSGDDHNDDDHHRGAQSQEGDQDAVESEEGEEQPSVPGVFQVFDQAGRFRSKVMLAACEYYYNNLLAPNKDSDADRPWLPIAKGLDEDKDWLGRMAKVPYLYRANVVQDGGTIFIVGMAREHHACGTPEVSAQTANWCVATGDRLLQVYNNLSIGFAGSYRQPDITIHPRHPSLLEPLDERRVANPRGIVEVDVKNRGPREIRRDFNAYFSSRAGTNSGDYMRFVLAFKYYSDTTAAVAVLWARPEDPVDGLVRAPVVIGAWDFGDIPAPDSTKQAFAAEEEAGDPLLPAVPTASWVRWAPGNPFRVDDVIQPFNLGPAGHGPPLIRIPPAMVCYRVVRRNGAAFMAAADLTIDLGRVLGALKVEA